MTHASGLEWIPVPAPLPGAGELACVELRGKKLLLCSVSGEPFAIEDRCPHVQISLLEGRLEGAVLQCPLHGGKLDVRNGRPVAAPIRKPVVTFPVRIRGERLEIGFPPIP